MFSERLGFEESFLDAKTWIIGTRSIFRKKNQNVVDGASADCRGLKGKIELCLGRRGAFSL